MCYRLQLRVGDSSDAKNGDFARHHLDEGCRDGTVTGDSRKQRVGSLVTGGRIGGAVGKLYAGRLGEAGNPTWDFFWALNNCAADLDQPGLEQSPRPDSQTKPHHSCSLACRPVGARFGLVADMGGMRVEATEQGETGQGCRLSTGPRKPQVDSVWVAHREAQRERRLG